MTPTRTNRPLGAIPSSPSSGALTPAQPIALARRPRGIVLAGALVGVHLRRRVACVGNALSAAAPRRFPEGG